VICPCLPVMQCYDGLIRAALPVNREEEKP